MIPDKNFTDTFGNPILMAVFDNATDAILIGNDHGYFLDCNQAAITMFGFSKHEVTNMGMHQLFHYHSEKHYAMLWKKFLDSPVTSGMMDLQHRDGSVIKVNLKVKPAVMPGVHLFVISDMTRQIKKEKLLASCERRFKALVREGADLISIVDQEGNYRYLSDNCRQVMGSDLKHFIGQSAFEQIHPEDRSAVIVLFSKLKDSKRIQSEPFRFKDSNGNWRWLTTIATNLLDDPSIRGIVCNSRDVTETVIKTKQLKRSNERYKLIMNASGEAIFDWDIIEDKIEWGSGLLDNFGYGHIESSSQQFYNYIHLKDQNRVWAEIEEGMSSSDKEMIFSDFRFYKFNTDVAQVRCQLIFLRDQQGMVYRAVGTLRDISDQGSHLRSIQEHNIKLREIAWSQSHAVRMPLSRIVNLIGLIKTNPRIQQEIHEILELVLQSASDLEHNIREISSENIV